MSTFSWSAIAVRTASRRRTPRWSNATATFTATDRTRELRPYACAYTARRDRERPRSLARARAAAPGRLRPLRRHRQVGPPHLRHVRRRPDGGAAREVLPLRLREPEGPAQRPARLLEGTCLDAPLRHVPRGRGRLGRRPEDIPPVREHARGPSDAADPVGRRRHWIARTGS